MSRKPIPLYLKNTIFPLSAPSEVGFGLLIQQNSTETQLGSTVYQELNPGDSLGMSMVGSTMTLWYKPVGGAWSSLATASDSTLTAAGYLYLDVTGDVARIDDFGGGTPPLGLAPAPAQLAWLAGVSTVWQGLWGRDGSLIRWAQGVQNLWQRVWAQGAYATVGTTRLELRARAAAVQSLTPPPAGQLWRNYIWVGDRRIAVHEYTASGDTVSFLLSDHEGSTSLTTDAAGALQSEIRYTAYGETRLSSGVTPTHYRYTGQLSQMETVGLYYYGARWYDPSIMMWASPDTLVPDPYNPLDWNRYSYVRYNPINNADPTGHRPCGAYCEGDWIDERTINTLGSNWDIKQQKEYSAKVESVMTGVVKVELGVVSPILLLGFKTINDEEISGTDVAFATVPVLGNFGGEISAIVNETDDAISSGKQFTGQIHHMLSNPIMRALNRHPTLSGSLSRDDLIVQAVDKASHYGYQTWHRVYDSSVVKWLQVSENQSVSVKDFIGYLQKVYSESAMSARFPDAIKTIQGFLEN